jgi:hypothetical protein
VKTIDIFKMRSPYRGDFVIKGYLFGGQQKTIAVVGSMRGDEVQQLYVASQVVKNLQILEEEGRLSNDVGILVIPTANPFSLNVMKRFWTMDNTDINRMFPGYSEGETTQRIADAVFEAVRNYTWGIQLASYYMNGNFVPHVRIMQTGYEDAASAEAFGLPYILLYKPRPFDTTVLNYNWQVFGTQAYSIYSGSTDSINHDMAKQTWQAILRFMAKLGAIHPNLGPAYQPITFDESRLHTILSEHAGLLFLRRHVGETIRHGDLLASILDPLTGQTRQDVFSPSDGVIFFAHTKPLTYGHTRLFQIFEQP